MTSIGPGYFSSVAGRMPPLSGSPPISELESAMPRDTLVGFFDDLASKTGEFLVYDDGFRTYRHAYPDVAASARNFAARLADAGLRKGDAVLFWAENRP